MKSTVIWKEEFSFDAELDGHHITLEIAPELGGKDRGPRPKGLVLSSLAGCTAVDVLWILNKMKVRPDRFTVEAAGELAGESPKVFKKIHITYKFWGEELPLKKLERAVRLSQEKYCGVSAMLRQVADLSREIKINPDR